MRTMEALRSRLIPAAALALALAGAADAGITRTWISTTSIGVAGAGNDVALSPANDAVYAAGQRAGRFYVGKYSVADGSVQVEFSTTPGYALGVGVGPAGQVGVIGGVFLGSWTYVVPADTTTLISSYTVTQSSTAYAISILDPTQLQPVSTNWPVYTTGCYDAGAASTTPFRASAVIDANGNLFVGFNASSTTAVIRKYSALGAQVGTDVTISSDPYVYFEQLAIDTTTTPNKLYSIVEEPAQIRINAYNNDLSAFAGPVLRPWVGTDNSRRQSITVGQNQVIAGGQKYDNVSNQGNPYHTWAQQLTRSLTNVRQLSYQFAASNGGNSTFGLAQRPWNCGAFYSVGDSTGIWVGLYDGALNYTNVRYYDAATAFRGSAIAATASKAIYIAGQTKGGNLYVERLDDNSCGAPVPPPPQPCNVTPSAFPNPFKIGKDKVRIQYDLLPGVVNASVLPVVTLDIYGPNGSLVKTLTNQGRARFNTIVWDGRDNQSALVSPGNYDAILKITTNPPEGPVCRSLIRMGAR